MKRYKQLATAGAALSIVGILAGCATGGGGKTLGSVPTTNGTNTTTLNNNVTNNTNSTGSNQNQTNSNTTGNSTITSSQASSTTGMTPLNLSNAQISDIQNALKHINASNPASMEFGDGGEVFVPTEIPKNEKFLGVDSGGNVEFGMYVTLNFTGFKVMCGDKSVSQMAIRKTSTVTLANGATGTWYVSDPTAGGTTYYLTLPNGSTYITFYSNLKTVSQEQFQKMAGSMVALGTSQSNNTTTNTQPSNTTTNTVASMVYIRTSVRQTTDSKCRRTNDTAKELAWIHVASRSITIRRSDVLVSIQ